ncbi:hypothetical protein B296_00018382 [Ensete ventricosum]|uniref:HMA domain-containing protein n=1 Tax=Ensete ventricosum TaxID=4639 RepID=A0A426ZIV1_ENSVE|nr:hypothetical protein B296_00018382 [Ensete ventricosum]
MGRVLSSLLSTIFSLGDGHRSYNYRTYFYNTGNSSSNTHYHTEDTNMISMRITKGRPLSLQVGFHPLLPRSFNEPFRFSLLLGIDSVEVDLELEKVTVMGYIDRNKVLKEVRRSGKKAEFWPNPDLPLYFTSEKDYFYDEESFRDSYNYWRHGYNGDNHGHIPVPQRGEDPISNLFNDDDVNACSVM